MNSHFYKVLLYLTWQSAHLLWANYYQYAEPKINEINLFMIELLELIIFSICDRATANLSFWNWRIYTNHHAWCPFHILVQINSYKSNYKEKWNYVMLYVVCWMVIVSHQRSLFSVSIYILFAHIWLVFDFPIVSKTDFIDSIANNRLKLTLWSLQQLMLIKSFLLFPLYKTTE